MGSRGAAEVTDRGASTEFFRQQIENSGRLDNYTGRYRMSRTKSITANSGHTLPSNGVGAGGVVSALEQRRSEKALTNWAAYRDTLRSLAAGEDVDAAEVDIVLSMVDRTPAELENDVNEYRRRSQHYEAAKALPDLEKQLTAAGVKLEQAVAERDRVLAPLEAARIAAFEAVNTLRLRVEQTSHSAAQLRISWNDPVLGQRERQLRAELGSIMPQIQQAESRVADLRRDLEYYAGDKDAERQLGSQVESWQQKADDHRPRVAAIHAELPQIETQKTLP